MAVSQDGPQDLVLRASFRIQVDASSSTLNIAPVIHLENARHGDDVPVAVGAVPGSAFRERVSAKMPPFQVRLRPLAALAKAPPNAEPPAKAPPLNGPPASRSRTREPPAKAPPNAQSFAPPKAPPNAHSRVFAVPLVSPPPAPPSKAPPPKASSQLAPELLYSTAASSTAPYMPPVPAAPPYPPPRAKAPPYPPPRN